jgi:hypothetical protein
MLSREGVAQVALILPVTIGRDDAGSKVGTSASTSNDD